MLDRRTLFGAAAGVGTALTSFFTGRKAKAATKTKDASDIENRGTLKGLERLPTLDAENRDDFLTGFRVWRGSTVLRAATKRANAIVEAHGKDSRKDLPLDETLDLFKDDPLIGTEGVMRIYGQRFAHRNFFLSFADDADAYLSEMEAYDNIGPGTLKLNPDLDIPDFAKHEIHMQPGGYVGNAFAGHIYHYSTNAFYLARFSEKTIKMSTTPIWQARFPYRKTVRSNVSSIWAVALVSYPSPSKNGSPMRKSGAWKWAGPWSAMATCGPSIRVWM